MKTGVNAPRTRQPHGSAHMRAHGIKFTDAEWDRIKELALEQGCTAGAIIRRAVDAYQPDA